MLLPQFLGKLTTRMDESLIAEYICDSFEGIVPLKSWGELSFFYNLGLALPRGVYFATIKDRDGENDRASNLSRDGVYRLNIGIGRSAYMNLFGETPTRPPAGGVVETGHDFTRLDVLTPHPVYGWMSWVSVLNPSESTFEALKPLLKESHRLAQQKFEKRIRDSA